MCVNILDFYSLHIPRTYFTFLYMTFISCQVLSNCLLSVIVKFLYVKNAKRII